MPLLRSFTLSCDWPEAVLMLMVDENTVRPARSLMVTSALPMVLLVHWMKMLPVVGLGNTAIEDELETVPTASVIGVIVCDNVCWIKPAPLMEGEDEVSDIPV